MGRASALLFHFSTGGRYALVLWFNRAGHVLRLRNYSRLEGVIMRRILLALFVLFQLCCQPFLRYGFSCRSADYPA
jgi:hypothetical protein